MAQPQDRRVLRSKRAIREAFVALVLERGFEAVTVDEVTASADVSRGTFYAHFRDKDGLLLDIVAELATERGELMPMLDRTKPLGFSGLPVRYLLEHAERERDAYRVILRGEGDGAALRELMAFLTAQAVETFTARASHAGVAPRVPVAVLATAWAGEVVAVMSWWLEGDGEHTAAEMAGFLRDLSLRGRGWASGLEVRADGELVAPGDGTVDAAATTAAFPLY